MRKVNKILAKIGIIFSIIGIIGLLIKKEGNRRKKDYEIDRLNKIVWIRDFRTLFNDYYDKVKTFENKKEEGLYEDFSKEISDCERKIKIHLYGCGGKYDRIIIKYIELVNKSIFNLINIESDNFEDSCKIIKYLPEIILIYARNYLKVKYEFLVLEDENIKEESLDFDLVFATNLEEYSKQIEEFEKLLPKDTLCNL